MASSNPQRCSTTISLTTINSSDRNREIKFDDSNTIIVGRASKVESRGMVAKKDNALFECPVISREHAEIVLVDAGDEQDEVTITDLGSMHGTYVNDKLLERYEPFTLQDGDIIRLGTSVARGNGELFQGVEVLYERNDEPVFSQVPSVSTFSVPAEDDEDEASDYDSDRDSIYEMKPISSTNTSPPSVKSRLGSQQEPIEIDSLPAGSLREILDMTVEQKVQLPTWQTTHEPKSPSADSIVMDSLRDDLHNRSLFASTSRLADGQEKVHAILNEILAGQEDNASGDHLSRHPADESSYHLRAASPELGQDETFIPNHSCKAFLNEDFQSWGHKYMPDTKQSEQKAPYDPVRDASPVQQSKPSSTTFNQELPSANNIDSLFQLVLPQQTNGGAPAAVETHQSAGKMAIPHIIAPQQTIAATVSKQYKDTLATGYRGDGLRCKRPATTAFGPDLDETSPTTKPKTTSKGVSHKSTNTYLSEAVMENRRKKKTKSRQVSKSAVFLREVGKYTLGAAVGMTGAVTLLASPVGGMIADWVQQL